MTLSVVKDTATTSAYPAIVVKVRPSPSENLQKNLKRLMAARGWKQPQLAAASGISQTHIGSILRGESSCTIETADALAKPFGVTSWHLIMPNLPDDLVQSQALRKIVDAYINADQDGRDFLDAAAERESKRRK